MIRVSLLVSPEVLPRFTTLLQGGIYLDAEQGETLGGLLAALPGFTKKYIDQRVQTIFLNGLPADNLQQQLWGADAVIAISAAMPGLAGAIFRKGGAHASLRTETAKKLSDTHPTHKPIHIRLKFFNMIAVERGKRILGDGCILLASALEKFFIYRPPLFTSIQKILINKATVDDPQQLIDILHSDTTIHLTVKDNNDN